jgi:hypothetical protein
MTMEMRWSSSRLGDPFAILGVVLLAASAWAGDAGPSETIREAFRASSRGLTSGIGEGTYRHYRAVAEGDWQLKVDADVSTYFAERRYHIDLVLHRDELRKEDERRIIFDGEAVTEAWFMPAQHPTGAQAYVSLPPQNGDDLSRPWNGVFPWDVAQLSRNVWDLEQLTRKADRVELEIAQTTQGDLIMTHRLVGRDWIRIECPRRFGFNIAHFQHFNEGQKEPAREVRVEWKQGPSGLWLVRSMDETQVLRDAKRSAWRIRDVLKYTEFEPNAKVDPRMFTEDSLGLSPGSRIMDGRPGGKERIRGVR